MTVKINGAERNVPDGISLKNLLSELGLDSKHLAVAVNMDFIPRDGHEAALLREGDELEIVSPQAGG